MHKPNPAVFEPALAQLKVLGIGHESVMYVGDSLRDYEAAAAAGLMFRGVLHGTSSAQQFSDAGATCSDSLEQLLNETRL